MTRITRRTAKPSPRAAAQKANFNRRERDATYIHLDKVLERNMGQSENMFTQSGKLRIEFTGKSRRGDLDGDDIDSDDEYYNTNSKYSNDVNEDGDASDDEYQYPSNNDGHGHGHGHTHMPVNSKKVTTYKKKHGYEDDGFIVDDDEEPVVYDDDASEEEALLSEYDSDVDYNSEEDFD